MTALISNWRIDLVKDPSKIKEKCSIRKAKHELCFQTLLVKEQKGIKSGSGGGGEEIYLEEKKP